MRKNYIVNFITLTLALMATGAFAQGTWTGKANVPAAERSHAIGLRIGDRGYIGLGINGEANHLNDFWQYNPETNTWTQKADYPGEHTRSAVAFSINDKGYAGSGYKDGSGATKEFYEYDPEQNEWTQKANVPSTARYEAVAFSVGEYGFVGGGKTNSSYLKTFHKYDPQTDSWSGIADYPGSGRAGLSAFNINGTGYVGTGYRNEPAEPKNDFYSYNPGNNTWTRRADFGGAERSGAIGFAIGDRGYIGTGNTHETMYAPTADVWEYDPNEDQWREVAAFGGAGRIAGVAFSIGAKAYAGTGMVEDIEADLNNDLWEFNPPADGELNADFTANNICLGTNLQFVNNSTVPSNRSITESQWNFGDGNTSDSQNPNHTYGSTGTYTVTLTITDNTGNSDTQTRTVNVYELPSADFTFSQVDGLTVSFQQQSFGAGEFYWWFGDGDTAVVGNPTHTYLMDGIYEVCFSAYNMYGCEGKVCKLLDTYTLRIAEKQANSKLKVYPNPAESRFTVSSETLSSEPISIIVSDAIGRTIYSDSFKANGMFSKDIELPKVNAGLYMVKVKNGGDMSRVKLVIR
jgi:N-acetylneuraminic acid mutarotase